MNFQFETEKLCQALRRLNNKKRVDLIGFSRTVPNIDQSKREWAGLETGLFFMAFLLAEGGVMRVLFSVAAGNTQSCQGR